jgi:hypothetical protein
MSLTSDEIVDPADHAGHRNRTFADVEAELACRDLMVSFCAAVDAGLADEAASVFTEDCSVDIGNWTKQGRAATPRRISAVSDQFTRGADGRWLIAERRTATLASPPSPATEVNRSQS